jgi:hypothetical protein
MSNLPILDAHAAFVDVGSEQMHVSVAGGPPQVFGSFTSQLHALRDWLKAQGVRSVAMEATGVYWLPLYGVLEAARFEVCMVNGRQTRNLPGRKSDSGADIEMRQSKYLNNLVEQDHRAVKRIVRPMLGLKNFRCARAIIAGIETMHMIKKNQLDRLKDRAPSAAQQFYSRAL